MNAEERDLESACDRATVALMISVGGRTKSVIQGLNCLIPRLPKMRPIKVPRTTASRALGTNGSEVGKFKLALCQMDVSEDKEVLLHSGLIDQSVLLS